MCDYIYESTLYEVLSVVGHTRDAHMAYERLGLHMNCDPRRIV